jgi:predicted nucleic acid-binding protein
VTLLIVDASFLFAFLQGRDAFHPWAVAALEAHDGKLATCKAVLVETACLLRDRLDAKRRPLAAVAAGSIGFPFTLAREVKGCVFDPGRMQCGIASRLGIWHTYGA